MAISITCRKLRYTTQLIMLWLLLFHTHAALAACNFASGYSMNNAIVNLPSTLSVKRDAAVGTVIYDSGWIDGGATRVNCGGGEGATYGYASSMIPVTGMAHVYQTGIQGIGIKAVYSNSYGSQPANIDSVSPSRGSRYMEWPRSSEATLNGPYTPAGLYRIQFLVTGKLLLGSQTTTLPNPASQTLYGSTLTNKATFTNSSIDITGVGCVISNANIIVNLDAATAASFNGLGSTGKNTAFSIDMTCPQGISVSYQIDGAAASGIASTNGVLANGTGSGMASGVGVQVVNGNGTTAIPLGTLLAVTTTTSDNQQVSIPLNARYYQSASRITGGTVLAMATFTMNYQ